MVDSFIMLTPVLLLLLLLPTLFVGCALDAVGSRVTPEASLWFGAAVLGQGDPLAVTAAPIYLITVYWTLEGHLTLLGDPPRTIELPPQTKGSATSPFPNNVSDNSFDVEVSRPNMVIQTIKCRCDVFGAAGLIATTNTASQPMTAGREHVFLLVREKLSMPPLAPPPPPFTVVPQTVGN